MKLSVIIPTYNRVEKLKECLRCLATQSLSKEQYDIWVVDDGSTDGTKTFLEEWSSKKTATKNRHALFQKNQGQGVARNHALKHVEGDLTLFIGDDIYATKDFLKKHFEFHTKNPAPQKACLGLTEWDPKHKITPFMHWMTHGGYQFAYHTLRPNQQLSFWYFYTSNLSLKTALLKKNGFNLSFKGYGWEDIELAYRLEKEENLSLIYTPSALAFHDHFLDEKDLQRKMHSLAKNGKIFEKLQPEVRVLPRGFKKIVFMLLGSKVTLTALKFLKKILGSRIQELYWYALSKHYFLEGARLLK